MRVDWHIVCGAGCGVVLQARYGTGVGIQTGVLPPLQFLTLLCHHVTHVGIEVDHLHLGCLQQ